MLPLYIEESKTEIKTAFNCALFTLWLVFLYINLLLIIKILNTIFELS
jgi:hypothetical protein